MPRLAVGKAKSMWTRPLASAVEPIMYQRKALECRSTTKKANESGPTTGSTRLQLCLGHRRIQSWSAKVLELIKPYRDRPDLWDCCMKEYKDRNKKLDALIEIAVSFGVDKGEVHRKTTTKVIDFLRSFETVNHKLFCKLVTQLSTFHIVIRNFY